MIDLDLDILDWLGPAERDVVSRARLFLKIGKPPSDIEREAHRNKLIAQQAEIANLEANVYYHLVSRERVFNARKFDLWEYDEYKDYLKSEREAVTIVRDSELCDLHDTVTKLKVLQKYLDRIGWLLGAAAK